MVATPWQITRQVGCDHILQIISGASFPPEDNNVLNSFNPDGSRTGPGRPGKNRIAFILTHPALDEIPEGEGSDSEAQVAFALDSAILYQEPPLILSPTSDANYLRGTPKDLSKINPIIHVTPLSPLPIPVVGGPFSFPAGQAGAYVVYNQYPLAGPPPVGRSPLAISPADFLTIVPTAKPDVNGVLLFVFGVSNNVFVGSDPPSAFAGSFQVEIDWSHSLAS
jgi:hypothetical protein